ncbi:MAG: glycosyltransferase family 4 protein [Gemmatimonadaceae bacterium]|nr:glycosyltransferase family 4 protein [Chitinophagaceae bacterium]
MHILYLHQYFVPPDGNGGTRSYEMARRLVKAGHRVTMITTNAFFPDHYNLSKATTSLVMDGINLRIIKVPYSNRLSYTQRIKAFFDFAAKASIEAVRVKSVDLVFATSTPLTIAVPGMVGRIWHKRSMVFEVRDLWPELPIAIGALRNPLLKALATWLERTAYTHSSHIVALSPGMKDGIVRIGFSADKVTVIPNSCDVDLFRGDRRSQSEARFPFKSDGPVILYAGTFGPINGVEYLVEVAKEMLNLYESVRFVIAGDGRQKDLLIKQARSQGVLGKNLWIIPPVKKEEMPSLLSASTIATSLFINLPEMWKNSANKFFDALAAGRSVMINYGGWQADIINETGAGLVVPPDDPAAAARLLHDFLLDKERMKKARAAATLLSDTEFNRDRLFGKLLDVFESVQRNMPESRHKAADRFYR